MRVLHLMNASKIKDTTYIKRILNELKLTNVSLSIFTHFVIIRYIISRMLWGRYSLIHIHEPNNFVTSFFLMNIFESKPIVLSIYTEKNLNSENFNKLISRSRMIFFDKLSIFEVYKKKFKKNSEKFFLIETGVDIPNDVPIIGVQLKLKTTYAIKNDSSKNFNHTRVILEAFSHLPKNFQLYLADEYEDIDSIKYSVDNFGISSSSTFSNNLIDCDVLIDLEDSNLSSDTLHFLASGKKTIGRRRDIHIDGYYYLDNVGSKKLMGIVNAIAERKDKTDISTISKLYSWKSRAEQYKLLYDLIINPGR